MATPSSSACRQKSELSTMGMRAVAFCMSDSARRRLSVMVGLMRFGGY